MGFTDFLDGATNVIIGGVNNIGNAVSGGMDWLVSGGGRTGGGLADEDSYADEIFGGIDRTIDGAKKAGEVGAGLVQWLPVIGAMLCGVLVIKVFKSIF